MIVHRHTLKFHWKSRPPILHNQKQNINHIISYIFKTVQCKRYTRSIHCAVLLLIYFTGLLYTMRHWVCWGYGNGGKHIQIKLSVPIREFWAQTLKSTQNSTDHEVIFMCTCILFYWTTMLLCYTLCSEHIHYTRSHLEFNLTMLAELK